MSVYTCPSLTQFVEAEMLNSQYFIDCGHDLMGLKIRLSAACETQESNVHIIPKGVTKDNKQTKYTERGSIRYDINVTIIKEIDLENNGVEILLDSLKQKHPGKYFYVTNLVTRTKGPERHTCVWKRKASSANNSKIVSLLLTSIDNKSVVNTFSEDEVHHIVGNLPDDVCRLNTAPRVEARAVPMCDPTSF